jgi:hypothetical protein
VYALVPTCCLLPAVCCLLLAAYFCGFAFFAHYEHTGWTVCFFAEDKHHEKFALMFMSGVFA